MDIISPILSIVSFLCTSSGANMCYLCGLKENQEDLRNEMEELKATRDDVKRRVDEAETNPNEFMQRTHVVNHWLEQVQTIEDVVVEILQKVNQEIEGRCIGGYCPKNCWSARKIGKLVIRKRRDVKELRDKGSFADVATKLPPPLVQKEPVDLTVGMESMFDQVWRLIAEDEVRIMGLYGYGGVGKTTLLKQINNEFLKRTTTTTTTTTTHGFDVVIFVVVSKEINIDAIQKEIGNRLGLSSPNKTNICNALTRKNFVLLLDDIWERLDLQNIGIPHDPQNINSKIIFTTRSESVCGQMDANKKMRVECLSPDVAWALFQEKVGNETLNSHPELPELAKVVAKECDGLPLALITIGRTMSTKKTLQEWNHAITTLQKSASEFEGMCDKVLPRLKLSYDNLRNDTIKSCFLYCALFPEDYSIDKDKLIDYWIGEGFINYEIHRNVDEARNDGYNVIGELMGACLLESGTFGVKMHDMIRELALWIAHECDAVKRDKILIIGASDLTSETLLWCNAKRIYLRPLDRGEIKAVAPPPKSPNLLTLIYDSPSSSIPQNFFEFMPLLRVLDLSNSHMTTFPISITELLELQYLSLSDTKIQVLPVELGKLVKLKYLDLLFMRDLKKIESGVIGSLLELRVLNLYHCSGGDLWDFEEVYNLKHLNDVRITINTQHNLKKLLSNQNLQMCTRYLELKEKHNIPQSPSSSTRSTLRELELLSNLESLTIDSFPICYMEQQQHLRSFQNLREICIYGSNALKNLTWVGYVGNLKKLAVYSCEEIEEIIEEISSVDVFKSLKTLDLLDLPKLKSICRNALAFPCLESMSVLLCPQLKILPFDSGSNVNNTLRKIQGERRWWNQLQWEDDNVKSKFLPHFEERWG